VVRGRGTHDRAGSVTTLPEIVRTFKKGFERTPSHCGHAVTGTQVNVGLTQGVTKHRTRHVDVR
jgi:hypothetical protein